MRAITYSTSHAATAEKILDTYGLSANLREGKIPYSKLTEAQRREVKALHELENLWADISELKGAQEHYGTENPLEFVAEVMSDKDFQDFLRGRPTGERTLWQRFVDVVQRLLGMKMSPDMLGKALDLSQSFFTKPVETPGNPSFATFSHDPVSAAKQTDFVLNKAAKLGDAPLSIKQGFTKAHLYAAT
jgi:hypothetical protein